MYSDTSKFATGSAIYQIQNGIPKLIAYANKRLPEATKNDSITELELCKLAMNIASFVHLLKKEDFDVIVDNLALTHIVKSKAELTTTRIKRLQEVLSSYSFNLYYINGKDMILSNFLSRQKQDDSNVHEIIPISFNIQGILQSRYYNLGEGKVGKYLVQMRSQAKSCGKKYRSTWCRKALDLNVLPEKQVIIGVTKVKEVYQIKLMLGHRRAGLGHKMKNSSVPTN